MIFSSINFLIFWFFSLILHKFSFFNTIGFAGIIGIIFYSFQGIPNLAALLTVVATCYVFCRVRKYFVLFSLLLFTPLFLYKYLEILSFFNIPVTEFMIVNFINAPVPPGLSFATFSAFALLVLCKNFDKDISSLKTITGYLFFFPQLIAGPIVMPRSLIPQLTKFAPVKIDNILKGVFIFSIGFALKAIFADSIALYVDPIFSNISNSNFQDIIIATLLFSQQIFFDFNGYTIMAIGIAYSFGITLPENFNAPYLSTSISDFWKRWHITLSNWIRDFIYIPLGGSKCPKLRNYLSPNSRVSILRRLIDNQKIVRILEAHSPLSGLIAENTKIEKKGKIEQFEAMWSSSLTDSSLKGKPDNQSLDFSSRFNSLGDFFQEIS